MTTVTRVCSRRSRSPRIARRPGFFDTSFSSLFAYRGEMKLWSVVVVVVGVLPSSSPPPSVHFPPLRTRDSGPGTASTCVLCSSENWELVKGHSIEQIVSENREEDGAKFLRTVRPVERG
ncbi:hypothetical protein NL676_015375 [Syzygium grande]|nr:hypothetical protein NL676_015375 [Syzygium grande]